MGIYIPSLDMPIAGMSIEIAENVDGKVYARLGYGLDDWHEVISVPEHGRLVDADKLCKVLKALAADDWNQEVAPFSWAYAYECIADTVDTMQTVIPKEEP